ncbi:hypothetical protein JMJ77_0008146 [Colletotrichum scovillei]|uniref:Uncharacterized protein n=2 Tax=Colletotrichum scovillei TaxID=1209932 RepID=A0A9P7RGF5_9PEZI|nr:hypothetical protein JMJ77_0008146 [Colletotrichum scovillei]KAG7075113.1 hypothetical protein JMJ76_0011575 [Colletotrichum scovillei]KAG7082384.1 hypothetical protein JMJ78_0004486 [Colletotrichum scovillei]
MSKRASKRRHASPEPDLSLTEGVPIIKARRYPHRKDVEYHAPGRHRSLYEHHPPPPRSPKRHRHNRHIEAKSDTDGDLKMIPMPPESPSTALVLRTARTPGYKKDHRKNDDDSYLDIVRRRRKPKHKPGLELNHEPVNHRASKRRRSIIDDTGRELHQQQQCSDLVVDNYRFRNHLLSLLDEQRSSVECWARSVGAGGPAEPMDWQPEQERVVYIARDLVEYGCYEDRWRIGGGQEEQPQQQLKERPTAQLSSELVSWADQIEDGSDVCGASVLGLSLVDVIE